MEAKIKSGTFLAESCDRASETAPTTQKYHFFERRPLFLTFMPTIDIFR